MATPSSSLRVLVLDNHDFPREHTGPGPGDPGLAARADVAVAATQIADALAARGHTVERVDVDGAGEGAADLDVVGLLPRLRASRPDVVFNLCESLRGDSRHEVVVPTLLELAGVPYTGSGPLALGLALRKDRAKDVLRGRGVPTAESLVIASREELAAGRLPMPFPVPLPVIVKPSREDASVGIDATSVARDLPALVRAVERVLLELRQPAIVERYLEGRELNVALLGDRPPRVLPLHEIDFSGLPPGLPRIVTYAGKWDEASPEFVGTRPVPAALDPATHARVCAVALAAFEALGLAGYGRVDLRLDEQGGPRVIDVNPNCDLGAGAGFARAAAAAGLGYPALLDAICRLAIERARA